MKRSYIASLCLEHCQSLASPRPWTRSWDSRKSDEKCEHIVGGGRQVRWRMKVTYVATSWKSYYKRDDVWGIKGAICIHERESQHKIYVVLFDQLLRASIPRSPDPVDFARSQPLTPGDATAVNESDVSFTNLVPYIHNAHNNMHLPLACISSTTLQSRLQAGQKCTYATTCNIKT